MAIEVGKKHSAVVVKATRVSNGAIAFHGRCCGDVTSDVPHTIYVKPGMTDAEIEGKIQTHLRSVEAQHAAMQAADTIFEKYKTNGK